MLCLFILHFIRLSAQIKITNDTIPYLDLDQCIAFALQNHPFVKQSILNQSIVQKTNAINLSGWYPQVSFNADFSNYQQLPTSLIQSSAQSSVQAIKFGVFYTINPVLSLSQTLFNPALIYSAENARLLVEQAKQSSDSTKIGIISSVSKSFYGLLQNMEQINVLKEDTALLAKTERDAYNGYIAGTVDKTDYKQAIISWNNTKAQLVQADLNMIPLYAVLQQQMGFPPEKKFNVLFDTAQLMKNIGSDSVLKLNYENRIEYQLLNTQQMLQEKNINYYKYSALPSLNAFYDLDYESQSNQFSDLLVRNYPYSYLGATLSLPIFSGFQRLKSIQRASLQMKILDEQDEYLKTAIYTEYVTALANYKSNLYNLTLLKENDLMAKEVYMVVALQYKQGIVPYLNVITAQSNLISSQISFINALFTALSSKVDLERALGTISPKR